MPFQPQVSPFSTSATLLARKKERPKKDKRITELRYHLMHPQTPRPLRFGRSRYLRHWTIHRAWQLYRRQQREARERELQRLYHSMRDACEELRHMDELGNRAPLSDATPGVIEDEGGEAETREQVRARPTGKEVGRLYRKAMKKQDVWKGFPIEYARPLTDYPSRDGWNIGWKRP
ncbi:hypothetical protein P152DRAFT_473552 [Eremomyces bilateralis CBS 781.70]|uniref:Large ribosomal subunit protein mL40 n=1 Tax=Eremomyces bilateralis CBS 781.70 TaxID=1392243 RepID=A0A6G1G551_9PEZI|nr:uncharacterized protein P152DRAFT_473552 [Eremomyces bilateralis CBS 781.70]KAF1813030.1 hypothetical protein P152DRAFT_473552 [Eremomyces bilateralis CBS 781.70]